MSQNLSFVKLDGVESDSVSQNIPNPKWTLALINPKVNSEAQNPKSVSHSGEPKVTHGRTGTGWCSLRDVLEEAIKPYAFRVSPYPVECCPSNSLQTIFNVCFQVILSIENHLSCEQQDTMAVMVKEVFGSLLYTEEVCLYRI